MKRFFIFAAIVLLLLSSVSDAGLRAISAGTGGGSPGGSSYSIQYNNAGSFGGLLPGSTGTYCLDWTSLTAAPTLTNSGCPGTGGGATFQANGTNLSGQSTINFENSAAFNGLTAIFSNPSAGNVQLGFSGTLGNAGLTNSSITINGASTALGGTRSLSLASSDFANQGTTTTVLHGNAAGNPTFSAVAISTDVGGLGTGVAAALADNVGSPGAFVVFNGAAGTPSSLTLTNATACAISTCVSGLGTGVATAAAAAVSSAGGITSTIASGTSALGTTAISSGACATTVTTTATSVATTDVVAWGFNSNPTSTTGYQASSNGMLTIISWPTSGNVNFAVCNNTASSITPGSVTLNWRVTR